MYVVSTNIVIGVYWNETMQANDYLSPAPISFGHSLNVRNGWVRRFISETMQLTKFPTHYEQLTVTKSR